MKHSRPKFLSLFRAAFSDFGTIAPDGTLFSGRFTEPSGIPLYFSANISPKNQPQLSGTTSSDQNRKKTPLQTILNSSAPFQQRDAFYVVCLGKHVDRTAFHHIIVELFQVRYISAQSGRITGYVHDFLWA
ncbi:MAG: hypothetical protein H6Q57_920 [Geobacteraceae bacterium]|nr:hypothetical protein [Geobacteraceae bacterium]